MVQRAEALATGAGEEAVEGRSAAGDGRPNHTKTQQSEADTLGDIPPH